MNNTADDINIELYAVHKGERYVTIGFKDNAGRHNFRFFNLNLLRCWHLLINMVLLLSVVIGSAVKIAIFQIFSPGRGGSGHFLACMMVCYKDYNMRNIITAQNKKLINQHDSPPEMQPCNFRNTDSCPLSGNCHEKNIIYQYLMKLFTRHLNFNFNFLR